MTYIVDSITYELYLKDEEVFNNFMMNPRILHFTYDRGWMLFWSIFVCFLWPDRSRSVNEYIRMQFFFNVYILSLVFLQMKLYVYCLILYKMKNFYIGVFKACCEHMWFLVFNEGAPPGDSEHLRWNTQVDVLNFTLWVEKQKLSEVTMSIWDLGDFLVTMLFLAIILQWYIYLEFLMMHDNFHQRKMSCLGLICM